MGTEMAFPREKHLQSLSQPEVSVSTVLLGEEKEVLKSSGAGGT